jgi:CRISPR-associated endonuclease/helicase Cas3
MARRREITLDALAHLTADGREHVLIDHLRAVADLAGEFAGYFGSGGVGHLAGLWHDLGKYAANFQHMIRSENGFDAHIEGDTSGPRDHSTAGALHAMRSVSVPEHVRATLAFAIAGHHAGLSDWEKLRERLRIKADLLAAAQRGSPSPEALAAIDVALPGHLQDPGRTDQQRRRLEMWTRMVFSALCDADFLDTEAFYDATRVARRKNWQPIDGLGDRLAAHMSHLEADAGQGAVNTARAEIRRACLAAARERPGFFTLSVPTGGGKTLAAMSFALEHVRVHGHRRVVVAIPYTSIIEQNAAVYRRVFGEDVVLEHHSALDPISETPSNRIAAENWDAPIVVTTTVQLLESLFANRTSACRKLHRLARSIIILDEAQTFPPGVLRPILDGLSALVRDYGATVVVSTATQPALTRSTYLPEGLDDVREIVPAELDVFARLRRVRVRWPRADADPTSYESLAREVANEQDVLVIVHRRQDARDLCRLIDAATRRDETGHLSALMCAEHRSRTLAALHETRRSGRPARVVATQLVEAGVDLDFPVVYRALAGLDSIAQAAGRCNREGKLERPGDVRVFIAPTSPPIGVPQTGAAITRGMLGVDGDIDIDDPAQFRSYFERLYRAKDLDAKAIQRARAELRFRSVAGAFRIIENDWAAPIVVPYGEAVRHVDQLRRFGASRDRLRALQRYIVQIRTGQRQAWLDAGYATEIEGVVVLDPDSGGYDSRFGLEPDRVGQRTPESLIIDDGE